MVPLEVDSLADSGVYTIEFNVESENEFSELVSEEGNVHKVSFTLQFRLWPYYGATELTALDYGDLYVWSDINDWSGWMKCYVDEDNRYCLDVDNLEEGTYEYSLVIWYNDEEIPNPTEDDSVWDRKVNSGDSGTSGTNNIFTVTDNILAENETLGYIPIDVSPTLDTLANILPYRLHNYTLQFSFKYNDILEACPNYGSLYIAGSFDTYFDSYGNEQWNLNKLTPEGDGTYTYNVGDVYDGYWYYYSILFVYDEHDPSGWENVIVDNNLFIPYRSYGDSYYDQVDVTLSDTFENLYPQLGGTLESYTLIFSIYKGGYNQGSSGQSTYDWNVYIVGTVPGCSWDTGLVCDWTSTDSGNTVTFNVTLSGVVQGMTYKYQLLYLYGYSSEKSIGDGDWHYQVTTSDLDLNIPTDATEGGTQEITIESNFWFNSPDYRE